jgi:hypothetical protein
MDMIVIQQGLSSSSSEVKRNTNRFTHSFVILRA